jgi:RNA polymerase sigma factor (sigma-70 family)
MLVQQAKYTEMPDHEVWSQFKQGNTAAYEHIYKTFYDELFNYGLYFSKDTDTVYDCIQNLFSYLHEKRSSIGPTTNIKYYLFLCLKRSIIHTLSKNKKIISEDNFFSLTDTISNNNFEADVSETNNKLLNAINMLSGSQKEIIYLTYYKSFSSEEIASILQISSRTVYNQTYLAMQKLKKIME